MYISKVVPPRKSRGTFVPKNVLALGWVSLVTDVSSEMVTAVLPLYLVLTLGLNPLQFGVLDGLYLGVGAVVALAASHFADRWQRRKLVAGLGYGFSAVSRLGLLAGTAVPVVGAAIVADRLGKGVRTAPRDALISLSAEPGSLGRSFGVHRAMDAAGAFGGPLLAFAVLAAAPGRYDAVFVVSACVAAFGVLIFAAAVRDRRAEPAPRATLESLKDLRFRSVLAASVLLGLVTISDAFIFLLLQERLGLAAAWFPLLPLGTAGTFLLLAVPLGQLADRLGRRRVFIAGHVVLIAVYLMLAGPMNGTALLIAVLAGHGTFYAATDGVFMAVAGSFLSANRRASGMAVLRTGQGVARFVASVLAGAAWTAWGRTPMLLVAAVGLAVAMLPSALLLRRAT